MTAASIVAGLMLPGSLGVAIVTGIVFKIVDSLVMWGYESARNNFSMIKPTDRYDINKQTELESDSHKYLTGLKQ